MQGQGCCFHPLQVSRAQGYVRTHKEEENYFLGTLVTVPLTCSGPARMAGKVSG